MVAHGFGKCIKSLKDARSSHTRNHEVEVGAKGNSLKDQARTKGQGRFSNVFMCVCVCVYRVPHAVISDKEQDGQTRFALRDGRLGRVLVDKDP
jgi:hypothetical protein